MTRSLPHGGEVLAAVVVENNVASRPTVGLENASIVYEVPVEGGITRYLAIFSLADVGSMVGPVRSLRPYLTAWAAEWDAVVVHSGGSPEALGRVRFKAYPHVDEISAAGVYFWRDSARRRPHNLFTSRERLTEAWAALQLPAVSGFSPWPSTTTPAWAERPTDHPAVRVYTPDPDYCVGYTYRRDANAYERWLGGEPQRGGDGAPLWAKAVAVQVVPGRVVDREGRLSLDTGTGGEAFLFLNGRGFTGRWTRQGRRTIFTDADGEAIGFPGAPVWVTVVTNAATVVLPPTEVPVGSVAFPLGCEVGPSSTGDSSPTGARP